jgi:thiol-disulfide isomerase/thioredoxin
MNTLLKKLAVGIMLGLFVLLPSRAFAADEAVNLYFFWSKTCPHCEKEKTFLEAFAPRHPNVHIHAYEISNLASSILLQKVGDHLHIDVGGVPLTIIGRYHFVGYMNDEITGAQISEMVEKTIAEGYPDPAGVIIRSDTVPSPTPIEKPSTDASQTTRNINVPFVGTVDTKTLSLPILTVLVGLLDGFNPCAMWTLLFLISLLLGMKDRKRMWTLGIAFIASSAFVYFMFLSAWLNLFLFLGFIVWVRIVIALVALGAGGYNLRDYWVNRKGGCNVVGNEKRQKVFEKIRAVTQRRQLFLALGGIILLAFAVNLVELICSAGLPAIYTQILSLSKLPVWQYYIYLVFYILFFMLDDLIIFFTAMITLRAVGIQGKYSRYSHLIGGLLMLIIGILLLCKPEWLMFS